MGGAAERRHPKRLFNRCVCRPGSQSAEAKRIWHARAYKDPASSAPKAGVLIVWDPDHLQAKRDGKGEVAREEVVRGRVVKVEMEDAASGLEWTQIGVYMPVEGTG